LATYTEINQKVIRAAVPYRTNLSWMCDICRCDGIVLGKKTRQTIWDKLCKPSCKCRRFV